MRSLKFRDHNVILDRETDIGSIRNEVILKQDMDT